MAERHVADPSTAEDEIEYPAGQMHVYTPGELSTFKHVPMPQGLNAYQVHGEAGTQVWDPSEFVATTKPVGHEHTLLWPTTEHFPAPQGFREPAPSVLLDSLEP